LVLPLRSQCLRTSGSWRTPSVDWEWGRWWWSTPIDDHNVPKKLEFAPWILHYSRSFACSLLQSCKTKNPTTIHHKIHHSQRCAIHSHA
jgi:hypothetical protein